MWTGIVALPLGAVAQSGSPRHELVEVLSVGSESSSEYALTAVAGGKLDACNNLYTLHPVERSVRAFSPDGTLLRTVGGPGPGPGEFLNPTALGFMGDTLWVLDRAFDRFSLFDVTSGEYTGSVTYSAPTGSSTPVALLAGRRVLAVDYALPGSANDPSYAGSDLYVSDPDGGGAVLLRKLDMSGFPFAVRAPEQPPMNAFQTRQPFPNLPIFSTAADGTSVTVVTWELSAPDWVVRFETFDPTGRLESKTLFREEARPISAEEVRAAVEHLSSHIHRRSPSFRRHRLADIRKWVEEALVLPSAHPPFEQIIRTRGGIMWAARPVGWPRGLAWSVLSPSAEVLYDVGVQGGVRLVAVGGGNAWAYELDALDVPRLVKLRLAGVHSGIAGVAECP